MCKFSYGANGILLPSCENLIPRLDRCPMYAIEDIIALKAFSEGQAITEVY